MTTQQVLSELNNQLRKLGLAGMLNALDNRNQEAVRNQMAYCDFLSLLAEDELLMRHNRRHECLLKQANIRGRKTLENFDFRFNPSINQSLIKDLAGLRFLQEKCPVLILGPCGTGKSHIAQSIGFCAIKQGLEVLYTTQDHLSQLLQTAKAIGTYAKRLRALIKVPLLIIDDFALKPLKSPQDEDLHDLIAERYEQASTLITSNLAFDEWQQAFPNQLLAAATLDRLQHNAYVLVLEGESYRANKNKKKL